MNNQIKEIIFLLGLLVYFMIPTLAYIDWGLGFLIIVPMNILLLFGILVPTCNITFKEVESGK